ncbi:hypothetical protein [Streptomyces roseolus]|uniref:hypothetical protein n=1 Tax=Streptomyces roseolus TaxID=67358 RepID=UPI00199E8AB6|nr:hypothetical protein [Streptomyces roseolus]GGR40962.1 hypothetical protein GCM10010282_37070 [Streptomyces roseolus]
MEPGRSLTADDGVERFTGRSRESIVERLTERLDARTAAPWWTRLVRRHRDAVARGKPAPDLFLYPARRTGVDPAAGDSGPRTLQPLTGR